MKANLVTEWPSDMDMDHTIMDETELKSPVVVGERSYDVPRDVAQEIERLRVLVSGTGSTEEVAMRQLLLALGGCFYRHANSAEWGHKEGTPLHALINKEQADEFVVKYVAP